LLPLIAPPPSAGLYSAVFALCIASSIWYVGVREIGSAHPTRP
jgi:hypothetical protein